MFNLFSLVQKGGLIMVPILFLSIGTIVRALTICPEVVILGEPFGTLDATIPNQ